MEILDRDYFQREIENIDRKIDFAKNNRFFGYNYNRPCFGGRRWPYCYGPWFPGGFGYGAGLPWMLLALKTFFPRGTSRYDEDMGRMDYQIDNFNTYM